jgi:hypothetical protein
MPVFTDNYTVGADINIDAYPSGAPDYEYVRGSGSDILVSAANDRAQLNTADTSAAARIIDPVAPTGDQEITASVQCTSGGDSSYVIVRAAGGQNYYFAYLNLSSGTEVGLFRRHNGVSTTLTEVTRGITAGTHTMRLKAVGTGATVSLELQIDATTVITVDDTSADRKTSGTPGIGGYSFAGSTVWVDNVSVEDLTPPLSNHASHAALPFPIRGARYTLGIRYLDATRTPTDPVTPDTEISKDGAAFADCSSEVTTITGSNGAGYLTLSGAETDCALLFLAAKVASGPKPTLAVLHPRVLPILESGTAQAGAAGTITLASGAAAYTLTGCFVKTTGGTGGGGTGGTNNQVRLISSYDKTTKVATISPNWETNPASGTTYDILLPSNTMAMVLDMATLAEINTQLDTALADINLDHLAATATGIPPILAGTYLDQMMRDGTATYDRTTDSLQAIRDRGDAAWQTGGGGSITDILNVVPLIPQNIDLANTATWRCGLMLTNAVDDLPTATEITPGTISVDRKAIGGTSWTAVLTDQACSEAAGIIYYDVTFNSGAGYAEGDSLRFTFKSQKITVAANDYEISDTTGRIFYSEIRQTMRGTNNAATAAQIHTTALTESYAADGTAPTQAQLLFMIWSALSQFAIAGTTITCKQLNGTTTSMTFTLDSATNPTSRTRAT